MRQTSLMSMTNHAVGIGTWSQSMTIPIYLPRRCICKIPWPNGISKLDRELPSRSLRKSEESRARIAVNQENRSNQLAEGHHQSKINYRKRFRWLWRNGFDDGGRNEMKLRYCLFDLRNYQAWSRDKTKRAKNSYTEQKKVFSGRQLGLVQEETLVVLDTHATGDREDNVGWSGETQEKSHPEQEYSSVPKVKETDCRKSLNSQRPVLWLKLKIPCLWWARWKFSSCDYRHHPVCRDAFMAIVAHGYRLMVRAT